MGKHRVGLDINRGFKSEMRETVLSLASQSTSYNSPAWIFLYQIAIDRCCSYYIAK